MGQNIHIYPSAEETAEALAEFLVKEIADNIAGRGDCTVALSGGNTPKSLFRILAEKYPDSVDWASVNFFWVDERCVPPEDPDSNYGMTMQSFLGKIKIPASNIHRIKGEDDPEQEASRYSDEVSKCVPLKNGIPSFDLVLLGVGDDGHTASIFPGSEDLFLTDLICTSAVHPATGQKRVTLTGRVINNASTIVVFVTGKGKSGILREVIGSGDSGKDYPVSHVAPDKGNLLWYIDSDAGIFLA